MLKLSASLSKKLPIDGIEFSSRSVSAGIEVEMPSAGNTEETRCSLKQLYAILEFAVDDQLGNPGQNSDEGSSRRTPNSNGRKVTEAQLKAIRAIAEDRGVSGRHLRGLLDREFQARETQELSIRQASSLIDILKNNGKVRR